MIILQNPLVIDCLSYRVSGFLEIHIIIAGVIQAVPERTHHARQNIHIFQIVPQLGPGQDYVTNMYYVESMCKVVIRYALHVPRDISH